MYTIEEACRLLKIPLKKPRVAVQGFGNVGHIAAQMLFDKRASSIIAVSDPTAASQHAVASIHTKL